MSVDLTFTGRAVGSERVADQWETIEVAFGSERVQALEDHGLQIGWDDDSLWLSLPLGHDKATEETFGRLADTVANALRRAFDWELAE
jgi:hypothetical protein